MNHLVNNDTVEFRGRFVIQARYKDVIVDSAPKLRIILQKNYPDTLPIVYELDGKIESEHKLNDGALCVATEFDLRIQLCKSNSLEDYILKFLIPYFISYKSWKDSGNFIFGERKHGVEGIYQSISDFFSLKQTNRELISKFLSWSVKEKPFRHQFNLSIRKKMQLMYSHKIGKLRQAGILNLKKIYRGLKNQDEFEKLYYHYKKAKEEKAI